ncbi:MAG: 3D domain-containing protein [Desulfomicrobium sp.]|nr:3D domain-containing protein [Desulfomicrobium sp.]NLV97097.1 hypothetical protein [Desulfovibrionales bacterium]
MNSHGTFMVTALFFTLFSSLIGFGAYVSATTKAVAEVEAVEESYLAEVEKLNQKIDNERQKLAHQSEILRKIQVKDVTLTAYSPRVVECGPNPTITASMTKVRPGIVAVSWDLYEQGWVFGKKVYVQGHGVFEIADLMHKRFTDRVDIFFPKTEDAVQFGVQQATATLLLG